MSMLKRSKYHRAIVGCSAIATLACTVLVPSASFAQTTPPTNASNATGVNTTNAPTGGLGGSSSPNPAVISRISTLVSNVDLAQADFDTAVANLAKAETATPVAAANDTPVRFTVDKSVANLADCGCPNADTISSAPKTPSPELVAAKTAEADAAAKLAAARAEAKQFIESVKNGSVSTSTTNSQLW
jgi:hypothetical protein